ncbi:MAG: TolC family protein [Candidatus Omnitrophota bacterium]
MLRKTILLLFVTLLISVEVFAAGPIQSGDHLTLEICLDIARKANPQIMTAEHGVSASRSKIGQAKSAYYPQLNISSGYNHGWSDTGPTENSSDRYSTSIGVSQNIWDFGKTSAQVEIGKLNLDSSLLNLDEVSGRIVLKVKQAYYQVLQSRKAEEVAREAVAQYQKHLEQAQGFYETGKSPKFDVTKAEVDLSNAKVNLISAENAVRLAFLSLNNAMGVPDASEYTVEDNLSSRHPEITLDEALKTAYQNRPDLKTAATARKSAALSATLAQKNYYPAISGNAGYGWSGDDFSQKDSNWSAGVTLSVPLFNGFSTKHKVEEARANLRSAESQEETLKQGVFLEVKQAFLTLREAIAKIPVAELTVTQARENLELANGRYQAGVGSPIETTDSQVSYSQARYAYIQALYQYQTARANLDNAMGVK